MIEQLFEYIRYGSYPQNAGFGNLPIEYKQRLFIKLPIYHLTIKSSDWTLPLLISKLPYKVGFSLTINFFVKKYINGKGKVVFMWC